ncbi:MAG: UPF0149 family protein [Casimicrobiaceae bacterium]
MGAGESKPLSDAEISELEALLGAIPDERDPLDVAMLDGFLVGVLLQPDPVLPSAWLPLVFDAEGDATPPGDAADTTRAIGLIMRRYNELAACVAAREPFDPIVFELEDEHGEPLAGTEGIDALSLWAAGFTTALNAFPALQNAAEFDDELAALMIGILRHLPVDPDVAADVREELAREQEEIERETPLADLDDALDEVVECVLEIADITRPNKPVTRAAAKVGRNDLCPCGSGRKYKVCHGRDVH